MTAGAVFARLRPTLASATADTAPVDLDGRFGLHAALSPLTPAFRAGDLAIVHGVGSDDDTRSHFEAQDRMEHAGPRALSVAKMVASTLPTHVTMAADWTGQITEYLKSRNVSVPSQEEARILAQKMEIPSDLLDEFPTKN